MNIFIINSINKLYNEANLSQANYLSLCKQPITLPEEIKLFVKKINGDTIYLRVNNG